VLRYLTPAQTKLTSSGKCGKPDNQQSIAAGDQIGHLFTLASGKCATKGEVGGATSKEGVFSEQGEVSEDHSKASGVHVETFDSGDKIFFTYQATGTMRDSAFQAGENKYGSGASTDSNTDLFRTFSNKPVGLLASRSPFRTPLFVSR
jgi:hypothetical protein